MALLYFMPKITFLPSQRRALESAKSEVILSGAFGSGKSLAICYKIVFLSLRYPNNRGFLCRKTLQSLKSTTLKTLLDGDGNVPAALPREYIVSHNKQDRLITLINGSEIWYGNMDKEFIKSMNLGWAAVDELSELLEEDWNALGGRLRLSGVPVRQLIAATNPASKQHWIWNRANINPPRDENGNPKIDFIKSSTLDNYYLPPEYIANLKATLFGYYYDRYVLGDWVGADAIVYDNFDSKIHVVPHFTIPKTWKRFRALDFGYRAPFSCTWFATAGDDAEKYGYNKDDMFLYREIYYTQRTAGVNAERVKEFSTYYDGTPEKIEYTVADWDAGDRAEFEARGIFSKPANKDIGVGIQKVRERLGNNDPTRGIVVKPRFFIFDNSLVEYDPKIRINFQGGENNNPTRAAEEFSAYGWKAGKEEPADEFNHALDGIRYFIVSYEGKQGWKDIPFMAANFTT